MCWQLETSGWQQFQRAFQKWWGCRKLFKDKKAGGWADGGRRVYTFRTAGTTAWSGGGCKTPALLEQSSR